MRHDFYLAWRYLRYHRARSLILIGCLSLIAILPLALHRLLDEGDRQMMARAGSTPLLVGAKGSALDLTLNTLYFTDADLPQLTMAEADRVGDTGWADALPIYTRFRLHGTPLVAVTPDYFDFRQLKPAHGRLLAVLGECVLGAEAADKLQLKPGDRLLTNPENLFDLAGVYPLRLTVAGVLRKAYTADDEAIFVDLKTAWVVEGLGHGHAAASSGTQPETLPFSRNLIADSKLVTYQEITPENLESFHFHGDPASYLITAIIAVPHDRRSATLLRGRYLAREDTAQVIDPLDTTRMLWQKIFRVGELFDAILLVAAIATLLLVGLVFALSLRLRQTEIQTVFLLGCSRGTVLRLVLAEMVLVVAGSTVSCLILLQLIDHYAGNLVRQFIMT